MPTPIRTDLPALHRRLALIAATQIAYLRKKQVRSEERALSEDDVRQTKTVTDLVNDIARLKRQIDSDNEKKLEKLSDEKLEEYANAAPADAPAKPAEPDADHAATGDSKRPDATPATGRAPSGGKARSAVGAKARGGRSRGS